MGFDEWCSPPEVALPLRGYYRRRKGYVDLDPATNGRSLIWSRRRYTAGALFLPWDGDFFENPPYSRMLDFARKAMAELDIPYRGRRKEATRLVTVATSTEWWEITVEKDPLLIFTKRLRFIDERGIQGDAARFDSVIQAWATPARERELVEHLGPIVLHTCRGRDWVPRKAKAYAA